MIDSLIAFLDKTSIVKKLCRNENRIVKYFTPKPSLKPAIICTFIALLVILVAISNGVKEGEILGAIVVAVLFGGGLLYLALLLARGWFGRATDKEVDEFVQNEIVAKQRERALKKLDLEWENVSKIPPIELWGWNLGDKMLDCVEGLIDVKGKDGVWRSPEVVCNAFYFSEETVHYSRWTTSVLLSDDYQSTDEIYYKDIVSVKQDVETKIFPDKSKARVETFSIHNTGGEGIQCPATGPEIEKAVSSFRAQLKAKKTV